VQKIVPNRWFDREAEAAAELYASIFPNSRTVNVTHDVAELHRAADSGDAG
jgi:predicted 3-demethylubiquinone-9 3-methyltransferase (glyoxalase superfamily)